MMLALDDPLRDTPLKAERYARLVHSMSDCQWDKVTDADVAAALKITAPRCECYGAPYGQHSTGCQFREATPFA